MTLDYETDLDSVDVNLNQRAEYLGQTSSNSKVMTTFISP